LSFPEIYLIKPVANKHKHVLSFKHILVLGTGFSRQFKTIQDNSRQFNTIQDNSRQFKTIQDNSIQFRTVQENSRQFKTIQDHSRQFKNIQDNSTKGKRRAYFLPLLKFTLQTRNK